MRCLVLRTSNYPDSPVNGWLPSEVYFQDYVFTLLRERRCEIKALWPAWGWHDLQACHREFGVGNEDKVEKALANDRKKLPYFFGKMQTAHRMEREKCLHTNRFTLNMRDRGLVPDSRQCRQAEWAAAGSRCQRTVLEPSSSSALCSGCRDGRSDLCMLKVSSTL